MEIKEIKYFGEQTLSYLIDKFKQTFALHTHTHTAEEVGADTKGSASAALALAEEYTNEQIKNHTHDDLYYTETEVDELISNITDGNTVVAKAEEATHATSADKATSADSAIKAIQDGDGNVITETYVLKTDVLTQANENSALLSYSPTEETDLSTKAYVDSHFLTEEETIELLAETGIIDAVVDEENNPLVTEAGDYIVL